MGIQLVNLVERLETDRASELFGCKKNRETFSMKSKVKNNDFYFPLFYQTMNKFTNRLKLGKSRVFMDLSDYC